MKYPPSTGFLSIAVLFDSLKKSFKMLVPSILIKNPIIFIAYLGACFTTLYILKQAFHGHFEFYYTRLNLWLWMIVLFANLAENLAKSKGPRVLLDEHPIERKVTVVEQETERSVSYLDLQKGDIIMCKEGDIIPADGEVIAGVALVDEAAITGESAPVMRESGGDLNSVTAGSRVLSDWIKIRIKNLPGQSLVDQRFALIDDSTRERTPNEAALIKILLGFTALLVLVVVDIKLFADFSASMSTSETTTFITFPVLMAILVCLMPTTISALLNAINIAGIDRLMHCNVIAKSRRSLELASDINLLILDKTGTITSGKRRAIAFYPLMGIEAKSLAEIALWASISDVTIEGQSIVQLAHQNFGLTPDSLDTTHCSPIPFSPHKRLSGVDLCDSNGKMLRQLRKGAPDVILAYVTALGGKSSTQAESLMSAISRRGGTALLVSDNQKIMGVIELKDEVKENLNNRFALLRAMGIRTLMITGDNPLTAATVAAEIGVDDYIAQASPEVKLDLIKREQRAGRIVAMTGDGTSDAPALAQANIGIAMNAGTQASREAANMVDLDNNPTKLIEIIEISQQWLITRGSLLLFSFATDIGKYVAIIPAIFGGLYPLEEGKGALSTWDILRLHSPESAIFSALVFNALLIVCLMPLALKGFKKRTSSTQMLLRINVWLYGVGGLVLPFIGIKVIDFLWSFFNLI